MYIYKHQFSTRAFPREPVGNGRITSFYRGFGDPPMSKQSPASGAGTTSFTLNVTPQIKWAVTALFIRPVREESTWVCLAAVSEDDKPRILMNYFIQYRGNSAFRQIDAQKPASMDRDTYLDAVFQYLWSLIRADFMAGVAARMRRSPSFRVKVERARQDVMQGRACGTAPFLQRGDQAVV